VERLLGCRLTQGEQAAPLTQKGVGALGHVPELLPACGRLGVESCGVGVVAGVLGELGTGGAQGVLVEWVAGREPIGKSLGESGIAGRKRSSRSPSYSA
jgi:hypothetical protein